MKFFNFRARKAGFTLVELLVVIAIIAILAAILFPIFVRVQESGKRSKCATNLMNISRALQMYRDDNSGRNCSIWAGKTPDVSYDQGTFHFVIQKYANQRLSQDVSSTVNKRDTIYRCPSAPWLIGKWNTNYSYKHEGHAYTMNETGWRGGVVRGKFAGAGLHDSEFKRPTQIIIVGECMGWTPIGIGYGNGNIIDNGKIYEANDPGAPGWISRDPDRDEDIPLSDPSYITNHGGSRSKIYNIRVSHDGGANLLFYDGHIKWMKTTKGYNWSVYY